jgi:metal transporter CNNM
VVEGALQMGTKTALDVFTPLRRVFAIPIDTVLDQKSIVKIYSSGFSRIPVYERQAEKEKDTSAICGVLMTKQLIVVNPEDERLVKTLPL